MINRLVAAGSRIIAASLVFALMAFTLGGFLQETIRLPEVLVVPILLAATILIFVLYYYWTE